MYVIASIEKRRYRLWMQEMGMGSVTLGGSGAMLIRAVGDYRHSVVKFVASCSNSEACVRMFQLARFHLKLGQEVNVCLGGKSHRVYRSYTSRTQRVSVD